ncbi:hypothetical protein EVAR_76431_1 [Eumeta japonica]|uniref:Uncharacterized protein n=1 Tax=Eumeta variegata TaxID=151549 RepID=A0A4C1T7Z1_EUMVA|nr:hypothetical protein EVAR_76431_1 [Eumeta japonica]
MAMACEGKTRAVVRNKEPSKIKRSTAITQEVEHELRYRIAFCIDTGAREAHALHHTTGFFVKTTIIFVGRIVTITFPERKYPNLYWARFYEMNSRAHDRFVGMPTSAPRRRAGGAGGYVTLSISAGSVPCLHARRRAYPF